MGAPATVTSVSLNAGTRQIIAATHTVVHHVAITHGDVSWTQLDKALPMPIMALHENWPQFPPTSIWGAPSPNMVHTVAATALIVRESGFVPALDRQILKVTNLPAAHYELRINGTSVGKFTRSELTHGINIAHCPLRCWRRHTAFCRWHGNIHKFGSRPGARYSCQWAISGGLRRNFQSARTRVRLRRKHQS